MALTITGWNFDLPSYSPGSPMTVTVTYTSTDLQAAASVLSNLTVNVSDTVGTAAVTQTSTGAEPYPQFTVTNPGTTPLPTTVTATDDRPATSAVWTPGANTFDAGVAGVFTGTAVFTSLA